MYGLWRMTRTISVAELLVRNECQNAITKQYTYNSLVEWV